MRGKTERGVCPRCGSPISWVERQVKGGREYFIAVHYLGRVGGRKRVRKCYLGPEEYEYVSRLHQDLGLTFSGQIREKRVVYYLEAFITALSRAELDKPTLVEVLNKLKQLTSRLEEYVRRLEELEEGKTAEGG